MKRKIPNDKVIEIRFKIDQVKDESMFYMMKQMSEVNWSEVSRKGIEAYLIKRAKP